MRNIGKISETVLNRSVIKPIEQNKVGIREGASAGADCALFSNKAVATGQVAYQDKRACEHAITIACNNVYAGGGVPKYVTLSISMPDSYREIKLKEIMRQACECAANLNVKIVGGQTEYVAGLINPIINVTAIGEVEKELIDKSIQTKECDIVMTKWMALGGTSVIATEKEEDLKKKLPSYYIADAQELGCFYSIASEAAVAMKPAGTIAMHDVAGGGLFTALWELGEKIGMGCRIDLNSIPIRQETIEVCEVFDINPYRLRGDGSLLVVTEDSKTLIEELASQNILGTVIGRTTECIDRVVIRDDETRFLEPANGDELNKVIW